MSPAATLDEWADRYGELRSAGPGSACGWLGIPLSVASLLGMLWSAPIPAVLRDVSPAINFATLFVLATFVYYCILSISLGLAGFLFLLAMTAPSVWLAETSLPLGRMAALAFICVLLWQLSDTRKATGHWHVIPNLQYLMLGPIWLLRAAYRIVGLAY